MNDAARFVTGTEAAKWLATGESGAEPASPMETREWLATCAEFLAEPSSLVVASAPGGALAAFVRRDGFAARLDHLGVRELHEPTDVPHASEDSLAQALELLARQRLPLLLPRLPARSTALETLRRVFGRGVVARPAPGTPFVRIDGETDADRLLSASLRSDLRRARRRAEALGPVTVEILAPAPEELPPLWDEAIRVEAAGWKGRERSALACDKARGWFFRAWARRAAAAKRLRLAFLRIGGVTAAVQVAVEMSRRFWLLKIGYDESFAAASPGQLLMHETLRRAAARGVESHEFLGSPEPWTRRWTERLHPCLSVRAYAASSAGIAAFGTDVAKFAWDRLRGT